MNMNNNEKNILTSCYTSCVLLTPLPLADVSNDQRKRKTFANFSRLETKKLRSSQLKHIENWKRFEKKTSDYGGVRLLNEVAGELREALADST